MECMFQHGFEGVGGCGGQWLAQELTGALQELYRPMRNEDVIPGSPLVCPLKRAGPSKLPGTVSGGWSRMDGTDRYFSLRFFIIPWMGGTAFYASPLLGEK